MAPAGSVLLMVAASMIPAVTVLRCGLGWGVLCYGAAALLTLLLFHGRLKSLLFVVVLGHYGVSKSLIERLHRLPLEWTCKLLLLNAALALCWWLYTAVLAQPLPLLHPLWVVWLLANVVFVLYDLGFTAMIGWFLRRFPGHS